MCVRCATVLVLTVIPSLAYRTDVVPLIRHRTPRHSSLQAMADGEFMAEDPAAAAVGSSTEVRSRGVVSELPFVGPSLPAQSLAPWTVVKGLFHCKSFHEFMMHVRAAHGDTVRVNLWPVLPPIYLMQGRAANRAVLFELDDSLQQVLQDLINVLPVSARIPSEVDVKLQNKVSQLFQNTGFVNERIPTFARVARRIREGWLKRERGGSLDIFFELSEYVIRADLEVLYGRSFCEKYADRILPSFRRWVENISDGQIVGFFAELGAYLREALDDRRARPELYEGERSVLQVYLQDGALERHDVDGLVGLLTMTLMAAVFNTQVSLGWILVHLYSEPALLARARTEVAACPEAASYSQIERMTFLNACIDESVRLHTMLPGNTVLRKSKVDLTFENTHIPEGSILWLYPNAVHQDEQYFAQPRSFCPMRMMQGGNLDRMNKNFELITFGHGQKRCIGEKMARAMVCVFLSEVLLAVDARVDELPSDNNLFDLIPASKLRLHDVRAVGRALPDEPPPA